MKQLFLRRADKGGMRKQKFDQLSYDVIGACIEVHRQLGPGLLESTYEHCLCRELSLRDIPFQRQLPIPVEYKGALLDCGYRIDVAFGEDLIVELKAVEQLLPVHIAQVLTYLKLGRFKCGLLLNFNVTSLREHGLRRLELKDPDLPDLPVKS